MKILTIILSCFALTISILNYRFTKRDKSNERLVREAILTLERAYEMLTQKGEQVPPIADRLNWLTTARLLESYSKLKKAIDRDDIQKLVLLQNEEYWRHKFYLALEPLATNFGYYQSDQSKKLIEKRSALVVVSFSNWPEGKIDEIDQLNLDDLISENTSALTMHPALRAFLGRL